MANFENGVSDYFCRNDIFSLASRCRMMWRLCIGISKADFCFRESGKR